MHQKRPSIAASNPTQVLLSPSRAHPETLGMPFAIVENGTIARPQKKMIQLKQQESL